MGGNLVACVAACAAPERTFWVPVARLLALGGYVGLSVTGRYRLYPWVGPPSLFGGNRLELIPFSTRPRGVAVACQRVC
jgi:hypothetical protein